MRQSPGPRPQFSRPNYLAEVTTALIYICDTNASGRLSIRNGERFGLAHLYFSEARLVHVTGDRSDSEVLLNDLLTWSKGSVRFDPAMTVNYETVNWQQAEIFTRWLAFLEMRGSMQDRPYARLDGLTQSLTTRLPKRPIALPEVVEHYQQYREEEALVRQWQRLSAGVNQFIQSAQRTVFGV